MRTTKEMKETTISNIITVVYRHWPATVNTSAKHALGSTSFKINGLWEIYEQVDDELRVVFKNRRELTMACVINWAMHGVITEMGKSKDTVVPGKIPPADLLPRLERHADEPTLQPEIHAVIRYVKGKYGDSFRVHRRL